MFKNYTISLLLFTLIWKTSLEEDLSILDTLLLPVSRNIRTKVHNFLIAANKNILRTISKNNRLQEIILDSVPFPCELTGTRSKTRPDNVHKLRPGDIDVIAAIGDSITAGYGLAASNNDLLSILIEERGKSFSIGGEGTWRNYRTLPNILKLFNPNLIGYSLKPSLTIERASQFNVAEGGAVSKQMPFMTQVLIKRIKADKRVNVEKDWKMITLLIGDNDFCSEICFLKNPEEALDKHKAEIMQVLRLIRDNLPRTIVNIIPPAHVKPLSSTVGKPLICHLIHKLVCPCVFHLRFQNRLKQFFDVMTRWQILDLEIASLSEFDRDDFAVVAQPFSLNITLNKFRNGRTDFSNLSLDCFHLSQKLNALVANNLWNNILEPVGRKTSLFSYNFSQINCPSNESPYIFTNRNSDIIKSV